MVRHILHHSHHSWKQYNTTCTQHCPSHFVKSKTVVRLDNVLRILIILWLIYFASANKNTSETRTSITDVWNAQMSVLHSAVFANWDVPFQSLVPRPKQLTSFRPCIQNPAKRKTATGTTWQIRTNQLSESRDVNSYSFWSRNCWRMHSLLSQNTNTLSHLYVLIFQVSDVVDVSRNFWIWLIWLIALIIA